MTTKCEITSLDSCSVTPTRGSNLRLAGLLLSFNQHFRSASYHPQFIFLIFSVQKYLAAAQPQTYTDNAELGASVAEKFAKAFGPVHRQLCRRHRPLRISFIDYLISQHLCVTCQTGSLIVPAFLPVNLRANATSQGRLLVCGWQLGKVSRFT